MSDILRLGTGAGFSADRLDPACDLVRDGHLDAIVFECIGERTLAFGHRDRMLDPSMGYNKWLSRRFLSILPLCVAHDVRLITNMGVANPRAAAEQTIEIAHELGLNGLTVAYLDGDDVSTLISQETWLPEENQSVADVELPFVGANAYLGIEALLPALETEADVIITGRVADPSLFLAPMVHRFGWALDDWNRLGQGTVVGHLMECAAQVTGGYFADPGVKDVPNLAYVGFPIAEVTPDGRATITKLSTAGGCVTMETVKEQLLYEIHDPTAYLTPDVTADFSTVQLADAGHDRVYVSGTAGRPYPTELKVTVAFDGGYLAEANISYAGIGAVNRARLAGEIVRERMMNLHQIQQELRVDLIGISALHGSATVDIDKPLVDSPPRGEDVRLRVALRSSNQDEAETLLWEVESLLCCGPAGGGGFRGNITPSVITHDTFLPRHQVETEIKVLVA